LKIAAGSIDDEGEKKRKHMAARTKKGRRTTGHDAVATIRLSSELRESVDAWNGLNDRLIAPDVDPLRQLFASAAIPASRVGS
jgi:hypothetical protein